VSRGAPGTHTTTPPVPAGLAPIVTDLDTVLDLGPGRLETDTVEEAARLRTRIEERLAIGDALTVVAFVGGTGAGKSALLNRLVGAEVATEGVRRPTTAVPLAVSGRTGADVDALLSWLEISDRRVADALGDDLILVDLPDHDSVVDAHRLTAERLRRRVDAVIVVLDPVKYARADLHEGPLAELVAHAEVTIVAFNRVDELTATDRAAALADAHEKLRERGLAGLEVLPTSAATGEGIGELRVRATDLAMKREAAVRRLAGDAALFGAAAAAGAPPPDDHDLDTSRLLGPLLEATDAHRNGVAAEVAYRRDARQATRSPLARVARAPMNLATRAARDLGIVAPPPTPDHGANVGPRVEGVLSREVELLTTTGAAHRTVAATIARTATDAAPALADAVRSIPLRPSRRGWWTGMSWTRGAAESVAVGGLIWLVLIGVAEWLQLPPVPTPAVNDDLSWPAALFLYGLVARVVLGIATRIVTRVGGGRHGRHVTDRLRTTVRATIDERITVPYRQEIARQRTLHDALARLTERR
jgi:GTP-binding protein EngB required for normal cell division